MRFQLELKYKNAMLTHVNDGIIFKISPKHEIFHIQFILKIISIHIVTKQLENTEKSLFLIVQKNVSHKPQDGKNPGLMYITHGSKIE